MGMRTTERDNEIAGLMFAIAAAEEQAQDAEDMELIGRASKFRAKARELKARLATLAA